MSLFIILIIFFTCDRHWLTRQPPYRHGGIILPDAGNSPVEVKARIIAQFVGAFHVQNKSLDMLRNRRFRLTRNALFEAPIGGKEVRIA